MIYDFSSADIEDFTTWTETDPEGAVSVNADYITYTDLDRDDETHVYDDKGANHFDGDFEHLIKVNLTSTDTYGNVAVWCISNTVTDRFNMDPQYSVFFKNGTVNLRLQEYEGSADNDDFNCSTGTDYWLEIERDEAVGANGTLYCRVYTDASRTTLSTTLSVTLDNKRDFQYIFTSLSVDLNQSAGTYEQSGRIDSLDLQEAAAEPFAPGRLPQIIKIDEISDNTVAGL